VPQSVPDKAAVDKLIAQLGALNDAEFAKALADSIMSPQAPTAERLAATERPDLLAWAARVHAPVRPGDSDDVIRTAIVQAHKVIDEMAAEERAAFRSPELAVRAQAAAKFLIDNVNTDIRRSAGESNKAWEGRAARYRNRVGYEHRILNEVVAGLYAQQGRLDNRPNPRRRAQERLWSLVLAGQPVGKDTLRELLADEEHKIEVRKAEEKERRRQMKRAAKATAGR
jgi:hypothetical protein